MVLRMDMDFKHCFHWQKASPKGEEANIINVNINVNMFRFVCYVIGWKEGGQEVDELWLVERKRTFF